MRKTMGFGVVLAAAYLTGGLGAAYAQTGTATYSSNYYQAGTYPRTYMGATPAYTNQIMPGYTSVNPMATTMAPGSYAGTAGTPYTTYYTPGYASPYGTTGYYTTQPYGNVVQQRGYGYPYYGYASGYGYGDPYY